MYQSNSNAYVAYKAQSALGTAASGSGANIFRIAGGNGIKSSKAAVESGDGDGDGDGDLSFEADVYPIISANCSCHVLGAPAMLAMPDAATAHMLLIACTGYASSEDRARARNAGFDAHCAKPLTPQLILRVLEFASEGSHRVADDLGDAYDGRSHAGR